MPPLSARSKKLVLLILLAGLALRIYYVFLPVTFDDDTTAYAQLATNWFHHGIYGFDSDAPNATPNTPPVPSLIRLPGYPLFLGLIFSIFGENLVAVRLIQALIDLLGVVLIAQVARKCISERAGLITLALAALCPFTASYAASAMTESLSIFCVALAIFATVYLLDALQQP